MRGRILSVVLAAGCLLLASGTVIGADRPSVPVAQHDERQFFRVVRAGFGQKRKQLKNALAGGLALKASTVADALERAGVSPRRRAETMSMEEWSALTNALAPHL